MRPNPSKNSYFTHIPTARIKANALNPRKTFEPEALEELAESLAVHGLLQPLVVYRKTNSFILICGERRLRAAKIAKLGIVPAIVHSEPPKDETVLAMMLIENLQRRDVDVVSESAAIKQLVEAHKWSLAEVSKNLGASIGFTRNRYLLTKFSDVLEAFTEGKVSYSEAIAFATLDDDKVRKWFFSRLESGELSDLKKLSAAVGRDKFLRQQILDGTILQQPLERSTVLFDVEGLPYCDSQCPNFVRVTWEEKRHYKIRPETPGWGEFCSEKCGSCYGKKLKAKICRDEDLQRLEFKRPIPEDSVLSMVWMEHTGIMCKSCKWMIASSQLEEAGCLPPEKAHAFCSCPESSCFDERMKMFSAERRLKESQVLQDSKDFRTALLDELRMVKGRTVPGTAHRRVLTKRECIYVLLQMVCHIGGHQRLRDFAEQHGWTENFPVAFDSQMIFLKNKLMDEIAEGDVYDLMLEEACLNSAFSSEGFPALRFDREAQIEKRVNFEVLP
jgi:ParB family chromosome partitioning protein